jgi:hypothetical protein
MTVDDLDIVLVSTFLLKHFFQLGVLSNCYQPYTTK